MRRSRAIRCVSTAISATLRGLATYLGWSALLGVGIAALHPAAALTWLAAWLLLFVVYPRLCPVRWRRRRAALLHVRPLGPSAARLAYALPFLLMGILLLQLAYARYAGWTQPPLTYAYAREPLGGLVVLGVVVVGAPIIEEFAFRGQLQGRATRTLGSWGAGALSAFFFAAAHWNAAWLPYFFVNGAIFAYLLARTGSIWAPVIAHGAINAWASALDPAHEWVVARSASIPSPLVALCAAGMLAASLLLVPGRAGAAGGRSSGSPCA